jgi:hypothetical protein
MIGVEIKIARLAASFNMAFPPVFQRIAIRMRRARVDGRVMARADSARGEGRMNRQ